MFWKNFVKLCNDKNVMPTNAVKDMGIAAGSITNWKSGSVPRDSTLIKIANYFGVTVDYLLGGEAEPKEKEKRPSSDERSEEFATLFNKMTPEQREIIIAQMKAIDSLNRGK